MTLNSAMALILRYFIEFVYDVVVKKFTFAISSPDKINFLLGPGINVYKFTRARSTFLYDTEVIWRKEKVIRL